MKIGIGITTFNRAACLEEMLSRNLWAFRDKMVIISDDGSTDSTQKVIEKFNFSCITSSNTGVANSKNRLFVALQECDYIFMSDDDVLVSDNFEQFYLKAHLKTQIQHFTFNPPGEHWGETGKESVFGDIVIQHPEYSGGAFSFYTKKVLEVCGGYSTWSHRDYSERIWSCGLSGKEKVNHIKGSENLISLMNVRCSVGKKERSSSFKRYDKATWEPVWGAKWKT